jgi:hypothetical protein
MLEQLSCRVSCLITIITEKDMVRFLAPLAAIAMLISGSAAMGQDARARANALENDARNGVKPFEEYSAKPRIIWRSPEIRPLLWEQQRVFDRSSHPFAILPN